MIIAVIKTIVMVMNNLRYQGTPNDNIALSPFECQAFHTNPDKLYISESLIIEDYENVFR